MRRTGWASRRGEREPGKSDSIDALAIARAVVKDGVESFPVAYLDERAMEIRQLQDYRDQLISDLDQWVSVAGSGWDARWRSGADRWVIAESPANAGLSV